MLAELRSAAQAADDALVRGMARLQGWDFGGHFGALSPRTRAGIVRGTYEAETVRACRRLVRRGMTALDVGASFGFFARLLASLVGPSGRVFAFEPHPEVFRLLARNVRRYPNVTPVPLAVAEHPGERSFYATTAPTLHSLHDMSRPSHAVAVSEQLTVGATTVDEFLAAHGGAAGGLIVKLDIEGAEPQALAGAADTLAAQRDAVIVLEFHPFCLRRAGADPAGFLRRLRQAFVVEALGASMGEVEAHCEDEHWHVNLLCRPA